MSAVLNTSVIVDGRFNHLEVQDLDVTSLDAKDFSADNLDAKDIVSDTLQVGTLHYPAAGVANSPLQGNLAGTGLFQGSKLLARQLDQITTLVDDHIQFDEILLSAGSKIVLDTTTPYSTAPNVASIGRVTLQPGKYHLRAAIHSYGNNGNPTDALRAYIFYDSDSGTPITAIPDGTALNGAYRFLVSDEAIFSPTVPTRIEFRMVRNEPVGVPRETQNSFLEITELPS